MPFMYEPCAAQRIGSNAGALPPTGEILRQQDKETMPIISAFFGLVLRMYYDEHDPPRIHVEFHGKKALLDFHGNILRGDLESRTALRLVREWVDIRQAELIEDWELAGLGKEIKKISPLD